MREDIIEAYCPRCKKFTYQTVKKEFDTLKKNRESVWIMRQHCHNCNYGRNGKIKWNRRWKYNG